MKIAISSGHGKYVAGANGYIQEHPEAVRVVNKTAEYLRAMDGIAVATFEDTTSRTQDENLATIVAWHNNSAFGGEAHDFDVSIHFNCNTTTSKPVGTECWYMTQDDLADDVASSIAMASGLIDRGSKYSNGLYFLKNTEAKAILVEVCFVDSKADVDLYQQYFDQICAGLAESLTGADVVPVPPEPPEPIPPSDDKPMLQKGDTGPYVFELQKKLGVLIADGDFGSITDTWVRAFQAACGLSVDGKVGNMTWGQVD